MSSEQRYPLLLLCVGLLLFTFGLGDRDLWAPDEPRYAGIARGILESGDWLTLRDNGRPYTDKPPLFFWILAATAWLGTGVTALSSRIPSSLFALLSVLLLYRLGSAIFSRRVGLLAGLVLATSQRFFLEARWVHIDMLLCFLILLAHAAAYRALDRKEGWPWLVAYAAVAMGCLAKGPVALALPAATLATYLASSRQGFRLRETGWLWGIPATLFPVTLWLWASSRRAGFAAAEVISVQVFRRFQEGVHHLRPAYYYLHALPLEFLPWTPFLAGAVAVTFPSVERTDRRPLLFLYGWILGGFVLLSLSAEKRPSYLLPLFPALALLVALFWEAYLVRWDATGLKMWIRIPLVLYTLAIVGSLLVVPFRVPAYPRLAGRLIVLGLIYLLTCLASLVAVGRGWRGAALLSLVAGLVAGYVWIAGSLLPWLNDYKSARPFSERVVGRIGSVPLAIYGDYHPAYAFYTHRRLEILKEPQDLMVFLTGSGGGYCLMDRRDFEALRLRFPLEELDREAVGHRTFLLVGAAARESP